MAGCKPVAAWCETKLLYMLVRSFTARGALKLRYRNWGGVVLMLGPAEHCRHGSTVSTLSVLKVCGCVMYAWWWWGRGIRCTVQHAMPVALQTSQPARG